MSQSPPPYTRRGWTTLSRTAKQLIAARFLRATAQGALAVDFTLYLKARGWSAQDVGLLLLASGLISAALSLVVGIVSDRVGRRVFLLIYETGLIIGTTLLVLVPNVWILVVVAAIFGFGRGANGTSGPFAPAEQAWLAQAIPDQHRSSVFNFNAGLQFGGMGVGSILAAALPALMSGASGPRVYILVFVLNLVMAVVNLWQIWILSEPPRPPRNLNAQHRSKKESTVTKRENRALALLVGVNMVNAVGVGLIAPLLPYWFNLKFGVGPTAIGPVYALTFFLTGLFAMMLSHVSDRMGLIRAIILPRILGVALLIAIPFVPSFAIAAPLYVARSIVNRSSMGARQAFGVGLVRDQRRGLASSLNTVSWGVAGAIGPAIGGWIIGLGSLVWPFIIAASLQLGYVILFPTLMGQYDTSRPPHPAEKSPGSS